MGHIFVIGIDKLIDPEDVASMMWIGFNEHYRRQSYENSFGVK